MLRRANTVAIARESFFMESQPVYCDKYDCGLYAGDEVKPIFKLLHVLKSKGNS
jgi:hypothetical protein